MLKRLTKELSDMQREIDAHKASNTPIEVEILPKENAIRHWSGFIVGPKDSPFEGGKFEIDLAVPATYPMAPPTVKIVTKIFHPNIHFKTGEVCLDILKTSWTPAWTLQSVCRAVIALLSHPEADSPLNCDAGNLIRNGDMRGYKSVAVMYTKLCAMDPQND